MTRAQSTNKSVKPLYKGGSCCPCDEYFGAVEYQVEVICSHSQNTISGIALACLGIECYPQASDVVERMAAVEPAFTKVPMATRIFSCMGSKKREVR